MAEKVEIVIEIHAEEATEGIKKLNDEVERLYQNLNHVKELWSALFTEK